MGHCHDEIGDAFQMACLEGRWVCSTNIVTEKCVTESRNFSKAAPRRRWRSRAPPFTTVEDGIAPSKDHLRRRLSAHVPSPAQLRPRTGASVPHIALRIQHQRLGAAEALHGGLGRQRNLARCGVIHCLPLALLSCACRVSPQISTLPSACRARPVAMVCWALAVVVWKAGRGRAEESGDEQLQPPRAEPAHLEMVFVVLMASPHSVCGGHCGVWQIRLVMHVTWERPFSLLEFGLWPM